MITFSHADQDALAVRAQQGDARAFEALYRSLDLLIRQITGRVAARFEVDAEDLHASAWLAIWRYALPKYEPSRGHFRTFATQRAFLEARRRAQIWREKTPESYSLDEYTDQLSWHEIHAADASSPEDDAHRRRECERVVSALARMPGRDGDVLLLRLAGHTLKKVAWAAGVRSRQAAQDLEARALGRLRRLMECA